MKIMTKMSGNELKSYIEEQESSRIVEIFTKVLAIPEKTEQVQMKL